MPTITISIFVFGLYSHSVNHIVGVGGTNLFFCALSLQGWKKT